MPHSITINLLDLKSILLEPMIKISHKFDEK